jgi:hypothetical protein
MEFIQQYLELHTKLRTLHPKSTGEFAQAPRSIVVITLEYP